jgi:hypothetical protein
MHQRKGRARSRQAACIRCLQALVRLLCRHAADSIARLPPCSFDATIAKRLRGHDGERERTGRDSTSVVLHHTARPSAM